MYYYGVLFSSRVLMDKELGKEKNGNWLIMAILHYFQLADFELSGIFITAILVKGFSLPSFLPYLKS